MEATDPLARLRRGRAPGRPSRVPLVRDVLLRDGSTLRLRAPGPEALDDLIAFYDRLSPESRYLRFHGYGRADAAAADYANADGVDRVALIGRHGDRVVAAAGYDVLREPGAAEVAFAVADDFQGRGAATRMLEQLAAIAAERGIRRFDAEVMQGNRAMITVFERAGFDVRRKSAFGELTVSLDLSPNEAVLDRIDARDHRGVVASLRPILAPASLAVVGASSEPGSLGGAVLQNILAGGFQGVATPVNRDGSVVRSIRAVRSLAELEEPPELVVIAVGADETPAIAADAAARGAKALLILAAGFADRGDEGRKLEERVLEIVRSAGLRMVGPNCLGVLNTDPAVSLNATFAGASVRAGRLAICSQSGAIGIGLLGHAAARRLGVSSFASLGNRARRLDERPAGTVGRGPANGRRDALRGDVRKPRTLRAHRAARRAAQADPRRQRPQARRRRARRGADAHGGGAAR